MAYQTSEEKTAPSGIPRDHGITSNVPIAMLDDEQLEAAGIYFRERLRAQRSEERQILIGRARRNVRAA